MADNWYVILELEFDPPIEDEQKIAERIEEKAKFWASHFNDFKFGAQYRAWHQNIAQIKKDMIGPVNIRKQLSADACTIVYGPVDKLLQTIGRKGHITSEEGEKISKKLKIDVDVVKKRAAKQGIKWTRATTDYQATYDKYYKNKPQNSAAFDGMKQMLASFGVDNLYDFLYSDTAVKNANRLPCDTLRQRADEKKKNEFHKKDSVSGTGSKLCGQCELVFKDENSKDVYDRYLEYTKRKAILDYAKSVADISGELTKEEGEETIGQLTQIFRDRKLSEEVLVAFCKIEKITYNTGSSDGKKSQLKICRCGCTNDVSDGRKVCSNCGLELEITCPNCGTKNDSNIKVCKCGFKFENIDKALALCEQAEAAIDALDFKAADAHLSDADRYWPNSSKVRALRQQLEEYKRRVGKEVSKMREAIDAKRYCEAKNLYNGIKRLFSGYSDFSIETEIDNAIAKAQQYFKIAKSSKTEKDILENCALAYDYCCDLPGVRELMPAPDPVTGFSVSANPFTRTNIVMWNTKNDKSVRYIVVRSKSGWVQHVPDGEVVYRGSASSYSDKDIIPGQSYYYNVFSERAGVFSAGAKGDFKEIYNLFEISKVSAAAADSSINIVWERLPENATAEIYETITNGKERYIASSSSDSYLVTGLKNDQTYSFRVSLSYLIRGKKQSTKGTIVSGTPTCLPQPIDSLRIKSNSNGQFEAVWWMTEKGDVRLFGSTSKPTYLLGDVVSISALEREMKQLQQTPLSAETKRVLKPKEYGASFHYSGSEVLYVVAVVVKAGSAVFGSIARASIGESVEIKSIRPVNGKINIYINVPKAATGFVVLYRFDQYPADLSDIKTVRKYIPIKQYQLNSALVLDNLEEKKYYISVFAEFRRDGDKDYSAGSNYLFDNSAKLDISYSIKVVKKRFGDNYLILEFEANEQAWVLPDIDIMSAVGNTPMFKESAKLFYAITSQEVNGTLQVRIPFSKNTPKDTYIKAFFKDGASQAGNQLKLKLKSNYKIN